MSCMAVCTELSFDGRCLRGSAFLGVERGVASAALVDFEVVSCQHLPVEYFLQLRDVRSSKVLFASYCLSLCY